MINNSLLDEINETAFPHPITDHVLKSDEEKIEIIESHMRVVLETLGMDLNNPSISDTPKRIAKMYVKELFSGLSNETFPKLSFVPTENNALREPILIKDIQVHSICEHHFLPMIGTAHVAYIPNNFIIGLSKIHRIVRYFSKRPQLQERLTSQITSALSKILQTEDVAIFLQLDHFCVKLRGIEDPNSITVTSAFHGAFQKDLSLKKDFFRKISR